MRHAPDNILKYMYYKKALSSFTVIDLSDSLKNQNLSAAETKHLIDDIVSMRYAVISGHEKLGASEQNRIIEISDCEIKGYLLGRGLVYVEDVDNIVITTWPIADLSEALFEENIYSSKMSFWMNLLKIALVIAGLLLAFLKVYFNLNS